MAAGRPTQTNTEYVANATKTDHASTRPMSSKVGRVKAETKRTKPVRRA